MQAVSGYVQTSRLPPYVYHQGMPALDPIQGFYIERLVHPQELAQQLRKLGFQARAMAYFGGARGGLLALANDLVTWLPQGMVLPHARSFRVLALKPDPLPVGRGPRERVGK